MRFNGGGCAGWLVVALAVWAWWAWNESRGPWTGWVYPDGSNLENSVRLGEFESFEQCRAAAVTVLETMQSYGGDFECGRRCRFDTNYGLHVCEETRN